MANQTPLKVGANNTPAEMTSGDVVNPSYVQAYATVQNNGTGQTQRTTIDFAGAGSVPVDDSTNSRTIVYSVDPALLSYLGGGL